MPIGAQHSHPLRACLVIIVNSQLRETWRAPEDNFSSNQCYHHQCVYTMLQELMLCYVSHDGYQVRMLDRTREYCLPPRRNSDMRTNFPNAPWMHICNMSPKFAKRCQNAYMDRRKVGWVEPMSGNDEVAGGACCLVGNKKGNK